MEKKEKNSLESLNDIIERENWNFKEGLNDAAISTNIVKLKERSLIDKENAYLAFKRTSDVIISTIALVALLPFILIIGILIKIDSKGPIFFIQERIGKDGKIFKMYKYRSMVVGADKILDQYLKENEDARKEYVQYKKLKKDPRITKLGAFIRKTSIDELPQLINVLKGDMSLVGPRPYLPREKTDMKDYYEYIIQSKPGITGMWQVSGRSETSFEERLNIDYTYNQAKSLKTDAKLLTKTIGIVLKRKGAM